MKMISGKELDFLVELQERIPSLINKQVLGHCLNLLRGIEYTDLQPILWFEKSYDQIGYANFHLSLKRIYEDALLRHELNFPNVIYNLGVLYFYVFEPINKGTETEYQNEMKNYWIKIVEKDNELANNKYIKQLIY